MCANNSKIFDEQCCDEDVEDIIWLCTKAPLLLQMEKKKEDQIK